MALRTVTLVSYSSSTLVNNASINCLPYISDSPAADPVLDHPTAAYPHGTSFSTPSFTLIRSALDDQSSPVPGSTIAKQSDTSPVSSTLANTSTSNRPSSNTQTHVEPNVSAPTTSLIDAAPAVPASMLSSTSPSSSVNILTGGCPSPVLYHPAAAHSHGTLSSIPSSPLIHSSLDDRLSPMPDSAITKQSGTSPLSSTLVNMPTSDCPSSNTQTHVEPNASVTTTSLIEPVPLAPASIAASLPMNHNNGTELELAKSLTRDNSVSKKRKFSGPSGPAMGSGQNQYHDTTKRLRSETAGNQREVSDDAHQNTDKDMNTSREGARTGSGENIEEVNGVGDETCRNTDKIVDTSKDSGWV
jgi:hypothetical protein